MNTSPVWTEGLTSSARLGGFLLIVEDRGSGWDPTTGKGVEVWRWLVMANPHKPLPTTTAVVGAMTFGKVYHHVDAKDPNKRGDQRREATYRAQRTAEAAAWNLILEDRPLGLYLMGAADDIRAEYEDVWADATKPAPTES